MSAAKTPTISKRNTDTFLRGIAIICVVLIHFLSSFKESPYINGAEYQIWAITLDQLARVAVPLFVALSGYGLMMKYSKSPLQWKEYLQKRVFKLLPLYVLWSFVYWFIFLLIPQWRPTPELKPLFGQLIFGNADYHLYFVPMIFQLYLLFPFIVRIVKKYPKVSLIVTAVCQLFFYVLISEKVTNQPGSSFFQSDQKQYFLFFSWIFYFILGMCLPKILVWLQRIKLESVVYVITVLGGILISLSAIHAIQHGVDPLIALRFTRWQVLLYASLTIVSLFLLTEQGKKFPSALLLLGEYSYLIYLSHTLLLRVIFLLINPHT